MTSPFGAKRTTIYPTSLIILINKTASLSIRISQRGFTLLIRGACVQARVANINKQSYTTKIAHILKKKKLYWLHVQKGDEMQKKKKKS